MLPFNNRFNKQIWFVLLLVMLLVPACGFTLTGENALKQPVAEKPAEEAAAEPVDPAASRMEDEDSAVVGATAPEGVEAPAAAGDGAMVVEKEVEALAAPPTATPPPMATAMPAEAPAVEEKSEMDRSESEAMAVQTEPLRAGEVDDNINWDDYLLYRRNYAGPRVHDRDVSERYIVEVQDGQGNPVLDAQVRILTTGGQQREEIYTVRTYANGQALFHPLALQAPTAQSDRFVVEVEKGNLRQQFTLTRFDAQSSSTFTERWTVTLDSYRPANALNLDVLFLIDATGSMADEIAKIQSTIFDVSAQIDALPGQPEVRYGMVTYRDRNDSFVTNVYDFTPDVRDFSKNLSTVWADGGGDYPESLNEGLHDAVNRVEWRSADTVKLIFLVADAPPHLDYAQDYDYAVEMENAARRGIKIFPIASSGLDDQGEYIFRQLAQYTMGRFIFLTYEGPTNGGAPGDVTTHHVDENDYSVENLDDLLVRLVEEELSYQNQQLAQQVR